MHPSCGSPRPSKKGVTTNWYQLLFIYRNRCHASSNRCLTSSNKKLLETSATLIYVSHMSCSLPSIRRSSWLSSARRVEPEPLGARFFRLVRPGGVSIDPGHPVLRSPACRWGGGVTQCLNQIHTTSPPPQDESACWALLGGMDLKSRLLCQTVVVLWIDSQPPKKASS